MRNPSAPRRLHGSATYHIVQKIRCEAAEAITNLALRALRESRKESTLALANEIEAGKYTVTQAFGDPRIRRNIDRAVYRNFELFALSAVGFGFTFTMTEQNHNSADATFNMPLINGSFGLKAGAGHALDRTNERKLTAGHTFLELYELTDRSVCGQIAAKAGNVLYPITGKIGLDEVFNTFYLLNRPPNDGLRPIPNEAFKNRGIGTDVIDFSDTLTFVTKVDAKLNPSISLEPGPVRQFRLASASATSMSSRDDTHKLRITVAVGKPVDSVDEARGMVGLRAAVPAAARAKTRAVQRIYELRTEDFFTAVSGERRRLGLPPL
jgi:hypothetical protein